MNIYNWATLVEYYIKHPDCKNTLQNWYHDVSSKKWLKPNDITRDYTKARTIKNNRVIFEINGNDYRLIAELNFEKGWLFIKFLGTHAEYDKIDPETINVYRKKK